MSALDIKRKKDSIKILFVGEGSYPMYERALYNASFDVPQIRPFIFTWQDEVSYMKKHIFGRIENKISIGPDINRINRKLLHLCKREGFDVVFLYSCRPIFPSVIRKIKQMDIYVMTYNNDNPFSERMPWYFWRNWRNSLEYCNLVYVYRTENITDCKNIGVKNPKLLRSYYNPDRIYYIEDDDNHVAVPDVLFLGHNEKDEREQYIKYLADNGIKVGIPNTSEWKGYEEDNANIIRLDNTQEKYNEMINKAKICLVFFSKINHDTYTRRVFEIPVAKTMMVSAYTDDMATLFSDKVEIEFFKDKIELLKIVSYYLSHEEERKKIADAGYERVIRDKHSSLDRVKMILNDYISDIR